MCDCEFDIDKVIRKGRGWYVCPICGADVSLWYIMIKSAEMEEKLGKRKNIKSSKTHPIKRRNVRKKSKRQ